MRPTTKRKLVTLTVGSKYDISWESSRTAAMTYTLKKVTDKGYNFVNTHTNVNLLKHHLYMSAKHARNDIRGRFWVNASMLMTLHDSTSTQQHTYNNQ